MKQLRVLAGVKKDMSVRRVLCGDGYRFLHLSKKGLSKRDDLKKRYKFARKVTKIMTDKILGRKYVFEN